MNIDLTQGPGPWNSTRECRFFPSCREKNIGPENSPRPKPIPRLKLQPFIRRTQ
jgi:hypothetical protein